jgi:hypothetical protein
MKSATIIAHPQKIAWMSKKKKVISTLVKLKVKNGK